jgi:hypothetical protein
MRRSVAFAPVGPWATPSLSVLGLIVAVSVAIGLSASNPRLLLGALGLGTSMVLGWLGSTPLLFIVLITSGVSLNFLGGDNGASSVSNFDGLRLGLVLTGFVILVARRPTVLGGTRWVLLYGAFLAYAVLSLLWTPSLLDGIKLICKLIYPMIAFLLVLDVLEREGDGRVQRYLCLAAIASTVLNVSVWLAGLSPWSGVGYEGRFGGASHPNTIGLFCAVTGLILYALWTRRPNRPYLVLIVLLCIQLILTGSRTALVAGGLAFLTFEALAGRWRRMVFVALVALAVWSMVPTFGERTTGASSEVGGFGGGSGMSLSGRMLLWSDAWASLMGDNQLVGRGLGTTDGFFTDRYIGLKSIHNGYLLLLIDVGAIGLVLILSFYFGHAVWLFLRSRVMGSTHVHGPLAIALIVSLLMSSFMESTFGGYAYPSSLLWVSLGLAVWTLRKPQPNRVGPGGRD